MNWYPITRQTLREMYTEKRKRDEKKALDKFCTTLRNDVITAANMGNSGILCPINDELILHQIDKVEEILMKCFPDSTVLINLQNKVITISWI